MSNLKPPHVISELTQLLNTIYGGLAEASLKKKFPISIAVSEADSKPPHSRVDGYQHGPDGLDVSPRGDAPSLCSGSG